jgi:DNA-binding GntR family transcriptional regulator
MSGVTAIRFVRPPTAQAAVLDELRRAIATGRLRPGDQIVQDALAAELGVSRLPLREALKTLEAEGLATYRAHRGYFVTELSLADLLEVNRLREILEGEAIRVGVPQLTAEDLDRLAELADDLERAAAAGDLASVPALNTRFHFALFEAAGMPRLERMLRTLWDSTDVYRTVDIQSPDRRARILDDHRAILAALRAGDAEEAVRLLDGHRENAVAAIRRMLGEEISAPGRVPR